jgi:hypothetical protein
MGDNAIADVVSCFCFYIVNQPTKFTPGNIKEIVDSYHQGIGVKAIADRLGICRQAVNRALLSQGLTPRNRAEQQAARMKRSTPEQRAQWAKAAHDAVRGKKKSFEELCAQALGRQKKATHAAPRSAYEQQLRDMLLSRGIITVPEMAVGPYNVDLAALPVAVELHGGGWHRYGAHIRRKKDRFDYILDAGWHIVAVFVHPIWYPLCESAADYVVAFIEQMRRNPSARREYRVIWSGMEGDLSGHAHNDDFTLEPPFTRRRNATTGQYERIAR